jgi:hypothetical protein
MLRIIRWMVLGALCAVPVRAAVHGPVLGEFELMELTVSCNTGAPACYTCINDANTTGDSRLMLALGASYPNMVTTGRAEGVLRPFIEIDGVRLDPPLMPCGSFLRSGIKWFDRPFAQNCPDTTKGVIYQIGGMSQAEVTGDGEVFLDIPIEEAAEIPFRFSLCSEFVYWGAGCGISGSSQHGWKLHTPAVPRAFEVAAGDAPPVAFSSSEIAFDLQSGPGGRVSVARAAGDAPGVPPVAHLNGYWDVHTDIPEGSYSASIQFGIDPASLPEGIDIAGIVVAAFSPMTQMWEPLTTSVDDTALTATVVTDRMGKFVLLESAPVPTERGTWGGLKSMYR